MRSSYNEPFKSGYTQYYEKFNELAPNFAIYARCTMSRDLKQLDTLEDPLKVHVMNCIGFAFDSTEQPDYKYFFDKGTISIQKNLELQNNVKKALSFLLYCAKYKNLKKVCFCYLGGGWFKKLYNESYLVDPSNKAAPLIHPSYINLFLKAFENSLTEFFEANPDYKFDEINFLGKGYIQKKDPVDEERIDAFITFCNKTYKPRKFKFVGGIPEILDEETLFMNAWDPHSVVGNGNRGDDSLDGFFGRLSNLALLCTPQVNRYMMNNLVQINVENNSFLEDYINDNFRTKGGRRLTKFRKPSKPTRKKKGRILHLTKVHPAKRNLTHRKS